MPGPATRHLTIGGNAPDRARCRMIQVYQFFGVRSVAESGRAHLIAVPVSNTPVRGTYNGCDAFRFANLDARTFKIAPTVAQRRTGSSTDRRIHSTAPAPTRRWRLRAASSMKKSDLGIGRLFKFSNRIKDSFLRARHRLWQNESRALREATIALPWRSPRRRKADPYGENMPHLSCELEHYGEAP